jgi:hypothetical protein
MRTNRRQLARSLGFIGAYSGWIVAYRLLILTFVTYFLTSSARGGRVRFEDVTETLSANELTLMGVSAILFVVTLRLLNPITSTTSAEIFTPTRLERGFVPGFLQGSVLATGFVVALLIAGTYRYLGFFIQVEETPMAASAVLTRIVALGCLAYFEEFIFRHKLTEHLEHLVPRPAAAVAVALAYCAVKWIQFDLGVMQALTLLLISLALSARRALEDDFTRGAGYWAAVLIVFQPILSLPALGGDFSGLFLIKYQPNESSELTRLLTGGAGGPLSGLLFQALVAGDAARSLLELRGLARRRRPSTSLA